MALGRLFHFIATPLFEAAAKKLLTEEDRRHLEVLLIRNPLAGQIIERTGGIRKMRFGRPSRREGKSGGTRVIYYFVDRKDRIYLIDVYGKNVKADLTRAEENRLSKLVKLLDEEEHE